MLEDLISREKLEALPPKERDKALKAIRELDYLREHNPLAVYFPHTKQHTFHSFSTPVKCFFGGNQSGKTTGGLADDLIQALDEKDLPSHLRPYKTFDPPFLCRIMAPSFPVLETVIYQKLQELVPGSVLVGDSWAKAFDKNTRTLYFKNGSRFFFQTYMMDKAMMGGATLDRVHYDEEPPLWARTECRIRVMKKAGDEIFTMTPTEGLTWTYDEFWVALQEHPIDDVKDAYRVGDVEAVQVDMDDNPTLGEEEKRRTLKGMSNEERQARKSGKFVALHGLIYAEFRKEEHVIPEIDQDDLPANRTVVVGIDPGIRNACAVVWMFVVRRDGVEDMVVFEEGRFEGMTIAAVCDRIHHVNALYNIVPLYYVIDPAARNKEHQTGRSDQMEYADHGVVTIAGQNAVPAGINRVKERFENSGLHIAENCRHLIEELQRYRWKEPPRSGEDGPQKPVKKDDHLLDAMRYAIMSRPFLSVDDPLEDERDPLQKAMEEDRKRAAQPVMAGPAHGVMF